MELEQDGLDTMDTNTQSIEHDDDSKGQLLDLVKQLELGDRPAREESIPTWKKHLIFWRGVQKMFWNAAARDWEVPSVSRYNQDVQGEYEEATNGVINYYRGYGESMIAALSASVPVIQYFPEDADKIDDIMTAKAYSRIEEAIRIHNQADIKLVEILYFLYNCGFVAVYNEQVKSEDFGVEVIPVLESREVQKSIDTCPLCQSSMEGDKCESCNYQGPGTPQSYTENEIVQNGTEEILKGRQIIRVYGPLNVKVSHSCRDQADIPYVILEDEVHYAMLRAIYPEYWNEISPSGIDVQDRSYRADVETGVVNNDLATLSRIWLRPWTYEALKDEDLRARLKAEYPKGLRLDVINNMVVRISDEQMDQVWSIAKSPLSLTVHAEPIGAVMIPIQEMRNDLIELVMETIRQGIPETFVDPTVVDLKAYNQVEARPGQKFPATAKFNKSISDAFHTQQGSVLSKEVQFFLDKLDNDAQFVTGAYPSIYGGQLTGGSKTLGEYEASKNQSLQRLSIHWKTVVTLWTRIFDRATRAFHRNMTGDEKFVKKSGNSFENVWIKEIELTGKVGDVRPESSDQFPISWVQKRSLLMDILNLKIPQITATIFHPENVGEISRTLGWSELFIPGELDRNIQLMEIAEMCEGKPDMQTGQSSVPIDPDLDAHEIHIESCKSYLNGPAGIELKRSNPGAYANIKMHLIAHTQFLQMTGTGQDPDQAKENQEPGPVSDPSAQPTGEM